MTIASDLLVWKEQNQLLIIKLIAPKNNRKILIGRIIQYDAEKCNILIYLDDDKTLSSVSIYEIDQIKPA
ncbi:MAG: hypothetical protein AB7V16_12410 [Vulcanibacillus sp.]